MSKLGKELIESLRETLDSERANNKVIHKTGDLFSVSGDNKILVHACNCKGKWGSGIAVEFKKRFPIAHEDYKGWCEKVGDKLLGMGFHHKYPAGDEQRVGYLFTSKGYGTLKDSEEEILKSTEKAVKMLLCITPESMEIHSPRINSVKFGVPWEKTEAVINECLKGKGHKWYVWTLENEVPKT
jgi:ADP-ribose 1''-phosphate phosphatase